MQVKIDFFIYKYSFRTSVKLFYIKKERFYCTLIYLFCTFLFFSKKDLIQMNLNIIQFLRN